MELPVPHPPVPPLVEIGDFNQRLRRWLDSDDPRATVDSALTRPLVRVGTTLCRLSTDTTRAGVEAYLAREMNSSGEYSVVPSSEGVARRVVPGRSPTRIPGFYLYAQEAFDRPQVIQPASPPLDEVSVAMLILDAVALLHQRGHQLLRIYPNISGSGLYWRTWVVAADEARFDVSGWPTWDGAAFSYSTADGYDVGGLLVDEGSAPEEIAGRILTAISPSREAGTGRDWAYAGWYAEMIGAVRRYRSLPVGDETIVIDDRRHWRLVPHGTVEEPPRFGPTVRH